jgi:electron transfer flavoprotein beta subunit
VAASKGLNEPRYPSLMGIMKAKKIPIKKLTLADVGISEIKNKIRTEKLYFPSEKPEGKVIEDEPEKAVKELVKLLKEEAKVL